jgi:response regulator of citrate/malate metabolism
MRAWGDGHVIAGYRGSEVLRGLTDKPAIAGVPVAILSAEASPATIRNMRSRGVIAYPIKPRDLTELGQLLDFFATGHDHGADPAPRTVPAP